MSGDGDGNGSFLPTLATNSNSGIQPRKRTYLIRKIIAFLQLLKELVVLIGLTIQAALAVVRRLTCPPSPKSLDGEVILITGAANGIGRAICLQLGDIGGATLVCWDIDKEGIEQLMRDLKVRRIMAYSYIVDIADRKLVEKAAAKVKADVGDVTMLINNAGIMPCRTFLNHDPAEIERMYQVNVLAHFWILREFLPSMIENNRGHIATVCSATGLIPIRNLVPYCGTKHAVNGYIDGLQSELLHDPRKPDIKFTTVYSITVQTQLIRGVKYHTRFPSLMPVLKPEEVAEKLIDGIRRNYERVFVPGYVRACAIVFRMITVKLAAAAQDFCQFYLEPEIQQQNQDSV